MTTQITKAPIFCLRKLALMSNTIKVILLKRQSVAGAVGTQPATLSDDRLCDALASGEVWAADVLYDRVEEIVGTVLFQVIGPADHERDDLIQQALEKVISTVVSGQFGRRCSLKSWAALITQHVAFDALRLRARERTVLDRSIVPETLELVATNDDTPELALDVRRRMESLRAALAATKRDRAEAVLLHDVLGHELTEIAQMTGVSVAAAQSRLVRGRKDVVTRMRSAEAKGKGRKQHG
ncbi:MAG TPA: RNA polymerase sigma factor [Polyangia bacterium]|jgi:RNA polymerase sigma-70 factor (ECF subfamily)|nr:RNA polymerase sigma factor [Polyangia bacterium]